jgi:uncharacterized membrane protein YhhN
MTALLLLSGVCAVLDWWAVGAAKRRLELITKPATLALLLAWFLGAIPRPWPPMGLAMAVGLAFSLAGDVFLLFADRRFIHGLGAFLLAQVAYTVALNAQGPVVSARSAAAALAVAGLSGWVLARIRAALIRAGHTRMLLPVTVYVVAISLMLWSAGCATLRPAWPSLAGGMVAAGGGLFYASDAVLAWNRFVRPFPGARVLNMILYHLGQYGLALGTFFLVLTR